MRLFAALVLCFVAVAGMAQKKVEYKTFVYTSEDLADEISKLSEERDSRGYFGDLFDASTNAMKGIASGYVTSFFDLGVNAIGSLVTRNARLRKEWEAAVKKENVYQTVINSVSEMNDFYSDPSFDGAMDPKGMRFDGIGCLRMEDSDTVFYISCHIDRTKLHRIVNHSKFELVLDTLILSPKHSNLPNTQLHIPYSFEERKNFTLKMDITITSSWMNEIVQLWKNQELGSFSITIPVEEKLLDNKGFLRYVREDGQNAYRVVGESFIVPRSYMGYRDEQDKFHNCWGTGEYKLSINIQESCDVTEQYRANWKKDLKKRKEMERQNRHLGIVDRTWKVVSSQHWDALAQTWVITTLKAPVSIVTSDVINKTGLKAKSTPNAAGQAAKSGAAGGGQGGKK